MTKLRISIFLGIILVLMMVLHWGVYQMAVTAFPQLVVSGGWLILVLLLLSSHFILASVFTHNYYNFAVNLFYKISAIYLGWFFYAVLSSLLWSLAILFFPQYSAGIAISLLLVAALAAVYGVLNAGIIKTTTYKISLPGHAWQGKRAVVVSDIHLGAVRDEKFVQKIVAKINLLNPDLIFIAGDYYDGTTCDRNKFAAPLAKLSALAQTYYITGNHDGFFESSHEIAAIRQAGVKALDNQIAEVDGVRIIGLSYHSTVNEKELNDVLAKMALDHSKPNILLKHVPSHIDVIEKHGIDLQISGHTHNGQIAPANLIASATHQGFGYGLKNLNEMQVLVSSGAGTWGPPLRVGTRSEIVLIDFS